MTSAATRLDSVFSEEGIDCPNSRMLLFALRRMAVGGVDDAHAAHSMFSFFGMSYRRPLILMRALMLEISRVSKKAIIIAPCCCGRMTRDEQTLLSVIGSANENPRDAHGELMRLLGRPDCLGTLSSAQAVGAAFSDLGRALETY